MRKTARSHQETAAFMGFDDLLLFEEDMPPCS